MAPSAQTQTIRENPPKPVATPDERGPDVVRRFPGWMTWGTVLLAFAAIVTVHFFRPYVDFIVFDNAFVNLVTLIAGAIAVFALWSWYVFRSTYAAGPRRLAMFAMVALVAGIVGTVRIDSVDGHMIPQKWRFAWQLPDDVVHRRQLDTRFTSGEGTSTDENAASVNDPSGSSTEDFTGFLGNDRTNRVDVTLADWKVPLKEAWRKPIGAGWSAFAVSGNYAVTMEQDADQEWVTCYDVRDGKPLWGSPVKARHENPLGGVGPRSTPTIDGDRVYALGATGILRCLKLGSGEEVWSDDLLARYFMKQADGIDEAGARSRQAIFESLVSWGYAGSPLVYGDLVISPAGGPVVDTKFAGRSLVAFNKATGKLAWEAGETQIAYTSPVVLKIGGEDHIVSVNETNVTGHNPKNGRVLWTYPWVGKSNADANNSQPHLVGEGLVFISKGYYSGSAMFSILGDDNGTAEAMTEWEDKRLLKTKFTNVTIIDGHAYGLSDGMMECADALKGKSKWKSRKGNFGHGQVLGVGKRIIVLGEKGELAMIEANQNKYVELARFQALTGKTWNPICLAGKRLLVRNSEEAVCFEIP